MVADLKLVKEPARTAVPAPEFAEAMSELASGVVLVTCHVGGRPWGLTVTAFTSISANPPLVLVSLRSSTASTGAIKASRRFGVSILADDQEAVARYGSTPGAPKFVDDLAVPGALAHLDCELHEGIDVGDHTLLLGRVVSTRVTHEGAALVYHRRDYRTVSDHQTTEEMRCLSS
jgi:flavin reductase (DIM6/NTAB) family NADH-FMN oxidoreductase RutF